MRKEKANTSRISIDAYRSRSTIDDTGCDREMVRSRHPCPRDYMGGRGTKGSRSQRWKAATLLGHLWWIDAFNALKTEQKKNLSLAQVLQEMYDVHRRLIVYVESVPLVQFQGETRFRRRLRLDTYCHYPIHAKAIWKWREKQGFKPRNSDSCH